MNVLLITPYYAPDLGPSAPLLAMLCEDLVARGHQVTALVAVPHFPSGQVASEYRRGVWQWQTQNGVHVCRVRVPSGNRASLRHRLMVFAIYQVLSSLAGLRLRYDVVLITNPALETWLPFVSLVTLRRKRSVYCVWDVYPDVGIRLGIFRQRSVIAVVKALEDFCLHRADVVQVFASEFSTTLESRGVSPNRLALIYPWLDTEFLKPLPRDNDFAREYNLASQFVIMYAGNLGHSQGLDHVLTAAQLLATDEGIRFVLVGDGANRDVLTAQVQQMKLTNVSFIPFQPRERLPYVLASADVALITLKRGIAQDSLPSKAFPVLASGRPIIASVDRDCELWRLIEKARAGLCIEPESPEQLARAVTTLKANQALCEQMGQNGRAYALRYHSRQSAAQSFEQLLSSLVVGKDSL